MRGGQCNRLRELFRASVRRSDGKLAQRVIHFNFKAHFIDGALAAGQ